MINEGLSQWSKEGKSSYNNFTQKLWPQYSWSAKTFKLFPLPGPAPYRILTCGPLSLRKW